MPRHAERKAPRADVEPLLTVAETCSVLGVGQSTFYRWLADSDIGIRAIAIVLPGERLRFPAWRLREWLEKRKGT